MKVREGEMEKQNASEMLINGPIKIQHAGLFYAHIYDQHS